MIKQIVFDSLVKYLKEGLPQECLIVETTQVTCQGEVKLIRVESEPKSDSTRQLVCAIQVKDSEVVIYSSNLFSPRVKRISAAIKLILDKIKDLFPFCLTLTECSMCCENCQKTWDIYH